MRSLSRSSITSLNCSPSRLSRDAQSQSHDVLYSSNKDAQQLRDRIDISKRKGGEHRSDATTRGCSPAHGTLRAPSNRDDDDCSVFTSTTTTSTGVSIINLSINVIYITMLIVFPSHLNEGLEYRPSKTPKKCRPVGHGIVSNFKNRKQVI